MKKNYLKMLLAAIGVLVGSSAWGAAGDVTTNANIAFSNSVTGSYSIAGSVGSMTWTQQWTMAPTVVGGVLQFGNFNGGVVELQNNNIGSKDIVTISFEMAFGKLSSKYVGFDLRDKDGITILSQRFRAYNNDFDGANPLNLNWDYMYHGSNTVIQERCVYFTIKLDYSKGTITTNTLCYLSGTGKAATEGEFTATLPSNKPLGAFVLTGNINNADRYSTFDNLLITTTEGNYDVATADYTVNWVCGSKVVKTETRSGDVDAPISLLGADTGNFTEGEQRYIYLESDVEGQTVASDGSTVITVNVREAEKWGWTATAKYAGAAISYSTSGEVWEDQPSISIPYPRFLAVGTQLVQKAPNGNDLRQNATVTEDGFAVDLEYSAVEGVDNLYLLSEAEDLGTGIATSGTTYGSRVSNGSIIYAAEGTLLSLPAGKYIFTLGAIGGDNNTHQVAYTVSAGENQIVEGTCTGNFLTLLKSAEFTLTEETDITFTCSDPASGRGIDLIYIQKTGDATPAAVAATIGAMGYSTFASIYALDLDNLPEGLKAYYVADSDVTDGSISLTEATGVVAAGEGLLLKGAAGASYDIPVATVAGSAIEGNYLKGVTDADGQEVGGMGKYVLVNDDVTGNVMFAMVFKDPSNYVKATVPAGKAYLDLLEALVGSAKERLFISFGGEATAINGVEAARKTAEGAIYNVAGQRVNGGYKGIVIKNGKKVLNR